MQWSCRSGHCRESILVFRENELNLINSLVVVVILRQVHKPIIVPYYCNRMCPAWKSDWNNSPELPTLPKADKCGGHLLISAVTNIPCGNRREFLKFTIFILHQDLEKGLWNGNKNTGITLVDINSSPRVFQRYILRVCDGVDALPQFENLFLGEALCPLIILVLTLIMHGNGS